MTTRKTRSWWGWGNIQDAVAGDERATLLARVASALPGADLTLHEPPGIAALGLPAPRVAPPASLGRLCSTDPADRAGHTYGKAYPRRRAQLLGDLRQPARPGRAAA